jgi:hypothetical protein
VSWPDDLFRNQRGAVRLGSADRPHGSLELGAETYRGDSLKIEMESHDPVHHAAREVVNALIETRWSLEAAVVVVALRRLCEAVAARGA